MGEAGRQTASLHGWDRLAEEVAGVYEDALAFKRQAIGRRFVTRVPAPDLSVVIVSYNTADLIEACLLSVRASDGVSLETFVVDNASSDGGAALVREKFPWVRLVENRENRGFGAANNQVLGECAGRYIVLLNPDTEATPEAFRRMAAWMDANPRVGLAGPTVNNPDGSRQDTVSRTYPGQKRTAGELSGLPGEIACVMGACQIVRTALMRELGRLRRGVLSLRGRPGPVPQDPEEGVPDRPRRRRGHPAPRRKERAWHAPRGHLAEEGGGGVPVLP